MPTAGETLAMRLRLRTRTGWGLRLELAIGAREWHQRIPWRSGLFGWG